MVVLQVAVPPQNSRVPSVILSSVTVFSFRTCTSRFRVGFPQPSVNMLAGKFRNSKFRP